MLPRRLKKETEAKRGKKKEGGGHKELGEVGDDRTQKRIGSDQGSVEPEEDESLQSFVEKHGPWKWSLISKSIPGRFEKSYGFRWCNPLSPRGELMTLSRTTGTPPSREGSRHHLP